MTYKVTMTATRPDTSVPFFYDAPEHSEQMAVVEAIRTELEAIPGAIVNYEKIISEDQLTYIQNWEFGNIGTWQKYMTTINTRLPRGIINRNLYFLDNGHKLVYSWVDAEGKEGSVVQVA